MLFRKKSPCSCTYCARGTVMEDGQILCVKRGLITEKEKCRKFRYDPCKRTPLKAKALDLKKYDDLDFSL
ncbi:MAG: hypothetical protein IJB11_04025 [Oscillospiraceae bacterium]|nr:hypothetical protein [Oscillospiraceae bacterium]